MPGGLIQLIAIGEQDTYLTKQPEITFFKTVYRRHTNFAIETYEEIFNNGTGFDKRITCNIQRHGDLLSNVCLQVELPSLNDTSRPEKYFSWVNAIGHALIDYVDIEIGGSVIDKQYGEWLEIWSEFTQTAEKRLGYHEMIGKKESFNCQNTGPMTLFIPLNFWFCKNIGLALPLISLQYHSVKINIKFNPFEKCWVSKIGTPKDLKPIDINQIKTSLLIDYVFLDLKERKKFAQESHMYLIEQIQFNGDTEYSKNNTIVNIPLNFNHPMKELFWVVQRHDVINTRFSSEDPDDPYNWNNGNDTFNFSNFRSKKATITETFDKMTLLFNGQQRFKDFTAKYFRLLQAYQYHTRIPSDYIYCYSFALKPEEHQPTGTCNFSRLDNVTLRMIKNKPDNVNRNYMSDYSVRVYGINYNVLFITGGMAGIAFSN